MLAVDDDAFIGASLQRLQLTTGHPFRYEIATNTKDAIRRLGNTEYIAVLADYVLGDGYGTDLVPIARGTPVIIMTGQGSEKVATEAVRVGAYDYLIKDIDNRFIDLVEPTIKRALARHRAELAEQQHAATMLQFKQENQALEHYAGLIAKSFETSLNTIERCCELLSGHSKIAGDRLASSYVQSADEGAKRARQIVNEVLELSRVTSSAGAMMTVDLTAALAEVRKEMAGVIDPERVHFGSLSSLVADPVQIRVMLRRLITRAERRCRATETDVQVYFECQRRTRELSLIVSDPCPEQPPNQRQRGSSAMHVSDDNLDLAVAQRIAERHLGTLLLGHGFREMHAVHVNLPLNLLSSADLGFSTD